MLAVLDPNVVISGVLSPGGAPADVLRALDRGEFELLVSPALLEELGRALAYPKLRRRIPESDADAVVRWVGESASTFASPEELGPFRSPDPGDDYLLTLAWQYSAALVSGDRDLLGLSDVVPVFSPRDFLRLLERS